MIIKNRVGDPKVENPTRAGKILVGGMIALPFIPLNKKSKYTNYPSTKSKFSEWVRCCKE